MKYNSGFRPVKTYPTNVRLRLKKKELNMDEALKVEKITTRADYSSLYNKFKAKLDDYEPLNCGCVRVYTGMCNTHSIILYVRGSHNIVEILKMSPFSFMEDLEIEERDNIDIKEAKEEWLDDNYNVVAYFEPYEPSIIGLDNKKGVVWGGCGDRFQVRLQTKEELLRQYLNGIR